MFTEWYDRTKRSDAQAGAIVPVSQVAWELAALLGVYRALKPRKILEIGSQHGGTLLHWMEYAEPGALIVSVDMGPGHWLPPADFDTSIWFQWARNCEHTFQFVKGDSHDEQIAAQVAGFTDAYDFLFIDGDHTYEGVRKDFLTYGRMMRKGGVIALHDLKTPATSTHIQVERLWREIQAAGYVTQELRSANSWFGGIGVVYL